MSAPRKLLPPPDRAGAAGLGGLLGGLGGAITCLCCLSAIGLIGLWAAFIPFVAFFKYTYDQQVRNDGGNANASSRNLQQTILLLICLLSIVFFKRQISK